MSLYQRDRSGRRRRLAMVQTSARVPRRGRPKLWAYGYADLALLFGMQEAAVRQAVKRQRLDPGSLASVVDFANRRGVRGELLRVTEDG
jgi:hypothetical protein